jgi:acyl phosphate:glycerol-3-phosphate acyltransferase
VPHFSPYLREVGFVEGSNREIHPANASLVLLPVQRCDSFDPRREMFTVILIAGVSYLLGSIPFGYLLVRIFRGEDVRRSGSGNIGATNVARKSPLLGAMTLLLDGLKGSVAILVGMYLSPRVIGCMDFLHRGPSPRILYGSLAALFAILGHMFPIWLKLRGGKGVATALGSFALIAPKAVLLAAAIFVVVVFIFRYVSLGSMLAVLAFPILAWVLREYGDSRAALILMAFSSILILAKHHANIHRLLAGTEPRFRSQRQSQDATEEERRDNP